jgi:hypothetical protein
MKINLLSGEQLRCGALVQLRFPLQSCSPLFRILRLGDMVLLESSGGHESEIPIGTLRAALHEGACVVMAGRPA